mgnify:CR=1 FL=1
MDIFPMLDNKANEPLYTQLYQYIKIEIQTGKIPPFKKLPSIRHLANDLHLSKTTIQQAYQQLLAEGYIESKERSGFYVVDIDKELLGHVFQSHSPPISEKRPQIKQQHIFYDFYMSNVDADHFPYLQWRRAMNQSINSDQKELLSYGHNQGEYSLRLEISNYLRQSRAVNCTAEQIIIGAGTQTLLTFLCYLIRSDHKSVAMEEPGYEGTRIVFQQLGLQIEPIQLQNDGINVKDLENSKAKAVYITPSHQYPLGMVMPITKRMKLLQWAQKNNGLIIEDDYDSEFRYNGKPVPSLQGLDVYGNVVYIGTFSKSLMPSIRISYMVLPTRLLQLYRDRLHTYTQTVSRLHQNTLQNFIKSGEWERHIRRMRKVYKKKHDTLIHTINNVMKGHVKITGQGAGLHIVIKVNSTITVDKLVQIAKDKGVSVYSTEKYWYYKNIEKDEKIILLGFGGLTIEEIKKGIARLNQAWLPFYSQN